MPLVTPSLKPSTLEYDSGLKFTLRTWAETDKNAILGENYDAKTKLLIVSNLGVGQLKDEVKVSAPIESGETFDNPGVCFSITNSGNIVKVITPCCWRLLTSVTAIKSKKKYIACPGCKKALVEHPVGISAGFASAKRMPKGGVLLDDFVEDWARPFENVYDAIITAHDLKQALEGFSKTSQDYLAALKLLDSKMRKHKRDVLKYARFEKKFTKYMAAVEKQLKQEDLVVPELERILRANTNHLL